MAAPVPKAPGPKPSFASVSVPTATSLNTLWGISLWSCQIAAMAPPSRNGPTVVGKENRKTTGLASISNLPHAAEGRRSQEELQDSMARLDVKGPPASKMLNEQAKTNIKRAGLSLDDDQTHVSSSSNKPPSLDGKSTTSGTTFALDEKESLRPDDSASAKAADDEDFGSGPASNAPNSRVGSEAGGRAFRDQFYEITESIGSGPHRPHPLSRRVIEGIEEEGPQPTQAPMVTAMPPQIPMARPDPSIPMQPSMEFLYREPDEKLFEALDSPKDRMFLLRLEQDIISFIKGSTEPKLDLPPCNSFCRLLAHKLADYYALTHFVDNAVSSVTLYRTPYCRIPTPLGELAKAQAANTPNGTQAAPPAMKIMRRPGKDGNVDSGAGTTESSVVPSKATSENGEDSQQGTGVVSPTESNLAKDKSSLTREEREARYREKREELFGPQSENGDSPDESKDVSRASSRNEKKKKSKHKRDDDGFEARSQFNAYYPTLPYHVSPYDPTAAGTYYNAFDIQQGNTPHQQGMPGATMMQQGFQQGYPSMPNMQGYPTTMGQPPMMTPYNGQTSQGYSQHQPQTYNQQTPTQFYAQLHPGIAMGQQSPAMSSPSMNSAQVSRPQSQMSDQQWQQNGYANSYQQPQPQPQFYPTGPSSISYPYGQLPYQPGFQNKAAHPLPGSYNRSTFNPATRAFVPGSGSMPHQQTVTGPNYGSMSPQPQNYGNTPNPAVMHSIPISYPNGNPQQPYNPQAQSYPQPQTYPPMPPMAGSYNPNTGSQDQSPKQYIQNHNVRKTTSQSQQSGTYNNNSPSQQSSLSKWGTPAHLPPKPPPVDTPSLPEAQHSLPMNNQFGVNVQAQVVNGGQPMPSFQNGVYTMPGVGGQ